MTEKSYEVDNEDNDDISQHMTVSYSEISFKSGLSPDEEVLPLNFDKDNHGQERPISLSCNEILGALTREGTVHIEGNMTHFVAEDLEYKIKLSSPQPRKEDISHFLGGVHSTTLGGPYKQTVIPQLRQKNVDLLNDLECEAQHLATSIDNLTENLCGILHSVCLT